MDQGQVKMAQQQEERDVHQPVVHDQGVLKSERVVTLAVPEEKTCDCKEDGQRSSDDRVDLLTCVEAALWSYAAAQPAEVVAVEAVDLARCCEETAAVACEQHQGERGEPRERCVDMDVFQQRPPADEFREARQVETESRAEQDEEGRRMHPLHCD